MRLIVALPFLILTLVGCSTVSLPELDDSGMELAPTEQRGLNYVDIDEDWRLSSEALTVTRDESQYQVLRASAQAGAVLSSLRLPHHSQVSTTASAEAIYYDAFQDRFEFVGDPIIKQGAKVTQGFGPEARLVMYSDGTIKVEKISSLVPAT